MKTNIAYSYDLTGMLDDRQFKTLMYWAQELSKKQIADKFELSEGWVDKELRMIYRKLRVRTRHGAVDKAWMLGIFTRQNR